MGSWVSFTGSFGKIRFHSSRIAGSPPSSPARIRRLKFSSASGFARSDKTFGFGWLAIAGPPQALVARFQQCTRIFGAMRAFLLRPLFVHHREPLLRRQAQLAVFTCRNFGGHLDRQIFRLVARGRVPGHGPRAIGVIVVFLVIALLSVNLHRRYERTGLAVPIPQPRVVVRFSKGL